MILSPIAFLAIAQKSPGELAELRKYRYGHSAAQIEAMGEDAYTKLFVQKTPDGDTGVFRSVAYSVYVDAYRENTERRYRSPLPAATQKRLLALDKQMRFIGVLFARNDWTFTGGNAFDPESDVLEFARAERQLYTTRTGSPDSARMRKRLATYRSETLAKSKKETLYGSPSNGRTQIAENLSKLDRAVKTADGLTRSQGERKVLYDFVADQAVERL